MDLDNNSNSSPVSEASSTPAVDTSSTSASPSPSSSIDTSGSFGGATEGVSQASTETPQAPAYQPNFKFKAAGKEYELDEEYRPYVKTPEDEKRIKRLMEQAKALDPIRSERDEFRGKSETYETELKTFHQGLETIKEMRAKGDVRSALMTLGLTPQEILIAAKQELDFDALPQQAKDTYYQSQESQRQAQYLAQQNQHYASQMQVLATEVRKTQLSNAMSRPEVTDFKTWYDGLNGPNAFEQRVINTGKQYHQLYGRDLSAEEAIQVVTEEFKAFRAQQNQQAIGQQNPAMGMQSNATQAPREVPVIPSAKGAAQAAATKGITSLDDLKKIRMEKYGY